LVFVGRTKWWGRICEKGNNGEEKIATNHRKVKFVSATTSATCRFRNCIYRTLVVLQHAFFGPLSLSSEFRIEPGSGSSFFSDSVNDNILLLLYYNIFKLLIKYYSLKKNVIDSLMIRSYSRCLLVSLFFSITNSDDARWKHKNNWLKCIESCCICSTHVRQMLLVRSP
jgi:hypothetical protein